MRSLGSHAKNWVMYLAYDLQLGRPTSALLLGIDGRVIFIYFNCAAGTPAASRPDSSRLGSKVQQIGDDHSAAS